MDEANYSAVVDSIYDAALHARMWPRALELMADAFGGGPAALLFQDQVTWLGSGATARLDPAALSDFYQHYAKLNPLTAKNHLAVLERGLPITLDQQVITKSDLMTTEFYNDFYRPNGMHSAIMITAGARGQSVATINIMRPPHAPEFDLDDIRFASDLQIHLARAFQLALRMADSARDDGTLAEIMDRSPHGLFLVGPDGRVQRSNRAASAMVGDGLALQQNELVATTPDAARQLRRLIGEAALGEGQRGGALRVPRPSQRRPLSVIVAPLGRQAASLFDAGPVTLVTVTDPEAAPSPPGAALVELFDLSPAEIRIAERLMLGDGPQQAAAALGIGVSTARWHLASLYRKTGTGRQVELVQLLLSVPSA